MKNVLIFLLLIFTLNAPAQNAEEYRPVEKSISCEGGECLIVIATNGLKLRDTTNQSGKILEIIPFGEKVEVIRNSVSEQSEMVDSLYGSWAKIKYKEKEGYVFNSYLSYAINKMDQPYYLLIPNAGCGENNYYSLKYNYYGFYKVDYNDAMDVRRVSPIFYVDWYESTLKTDSSVQPLFYIASRDTITSGVYKSNYYNENIFSTPEYSSIRGRKTIGLTNGEFYLDVEEFNSADTIPKELYLINQQTKQRQLIARSYFAFRLFWDGDFDMDGKPDFIIFVGGEHGGKYELFLSGKAKQGNFVKKIATFESGDCC